VFGVLLSQSHTNLPDVKVYFDETAADLVNFRDVLEGRPWQMYHVDYLINSYLCVYAVSGAAEPNTLLAVMGARCVHQS